jgi:HSP20 family molecular chaperone IbpA
MKSKILASVAILLMATGTQNSFCVGNFWADVEKVWGEEQTRIEHAFKSAYLVKSITENKNVLEVKLSLPGFKKDEISISITDGILKVDAKKKVSEEKNENEKDKKYIYRSKESTQASIRLDLKPYGIHTLDSKDVKNIKATHEDGILKLSIPKKDTDKGGITVEIQETEKEASKETVADVGVEAEEK